jgi:O-antigen ligase
VPLEQFGFKFSLPWLGTINMQGEWRRWYSNTDSVAMISGFYRSPEIMGWHAMALVVVSMYLTLRRPRFAWIWIPLATWGSYAVLMSGRRKMYLMILVFLLVYALVSDRRQRNRFLTYTLAAALAVVPLLFFFVEDAYLQTAESGLAVAGAKATEKGIRGTTWLIKIVGPFGYGVGTKSQGSQHVAGFVNTPLMEGGLEKILVELGIVGFAAAIFLLATMAWIGWRNVRLARFLGEDASGPVACFAMIAANLSAFLVAIQFFGDPFVITFIGFLVGLLFSTERLLRENLARSRLRKQTEQRDREEAASPPKGIVPDV